MTDVKLEVGMTARRRDGQRVRPVVKSGYSDGQPFCVGMAYYTSDGYFWETKKETEKDIIAAGFPWTTLGAQVGDTVRRVWNGLFNTADDWEFVCADEMVDVSPDSLFVMVKPAAKPAIRPRASHNLDLRDGDVVELVAWQSKAANQGLRIGETFVVGNEQWEGFIARHNPKGHRPLFRLISSAAGAKPDRVIVRYGFPEDADGTWTAKRYDADTYRCTITFPDGSDVVTVVREKL